MEQDNIEPAIPLSGFPAYLPLPYRVPIIISLGVFLFGTNITLLLRAGIDVEGLFYPAASASSATRKHDILARPLYAIAVTLLVMTAVSVASFWTVTGGSSMTTLDHPWLPCFLYLGFIAVLFSPIRLYAQERWRFLPLLRRIFLGGIDPTDRFLDIIVADVLTSYAKVFGDLVTTTYILLSASSSSYLEAKDYGSRSMLVPMAIAMPYAIRLRQCLIEYRRTKNVSHLANALKYCTAFPVILISSLQQGRNGAEVGTPNTSYISDGRLYQLWCLSCLINSGYSFWWDVTKDWDLTILSFRPSKFNAANPSPLTLHVPGEERYGLRRHLTFAPNTYYAAIGVDIVLRMLWSLKLSPHLHGLTEYESGIFIMECLEVGRRWMWIFLRVECEHHRTNSRDGAIALTDMGGIAFTSGTMGKVDQD